MDGSINRIMSLHRYYMPQIGAGMYLMRGGALTRYHTPVLTQRRGGLAENLLKVAGPSVVNAMQHTLRDVQQGKSLRASAQEHGQQLSKNLKCKVPSIALAVGKHSANQQYKKAKRRVKEIFTW